MSVSDETEKVPNRRSIALQRFVPCSPDIEIGVGAVAERMIEGEE